MELLIHLLLGVDGQHHIRHDTVGSGTLTVWEGSYELGTTSEPAYLYFHVYPTRRLQIAWHPVAGEVDLATGSRADSAHRGVVPYGA